MQKTAIVVPCHNEELRLEPELFLDHLANDPALFFVFVDDGSTDRTAEVIRRMQSANPEQIEILTLPQNQGKAEAVRLGMLQAASGPFHSVGYWDADLSTPLRTIRGF